MALPKLLQPAPAAPPAIPRGVIVMWSGAVNAVPTGWALCDGKNTTPDLRDRMVMGAGGKYAVGAKGGAETQNVSTALSGAVGATTLSVAQMPSHNHRGQNTVDISSSNRGDTYNIGIDDARTRFTSPTDNTGGSGSHTHTLSGSATGTIATLPPYYGLTYIMKL